MHAQTSPSPAAQPGPAQAAKLLAELKGHASTVTTLAFTADRCLLASAARDGAARIWAVASSKPGERSALARSGDSFRAFAFSPNGRQLVAGAGSASGLAWVYDVTEKAPQEVTTLRGARGHIGALAFSPDGKLIAGGGEDHTLRVWEPGPGFRGDSRALLPGHTKPLTAAAFAPDGQTVATGSQDGTVRLWTIGRIRSSLRSVLTHPDEVLALSYSGDGKTVATACRDGVVRLWDATAINPTVRSAFADTVGGLRVLLFADAATLVGVGYGSRVLNWDARTGKLVREWDVPGGPVASVALTLDGRYLARGLASGVVELYRVAEKRA
jgi:WD40 repeat protein